MLGVGGADDAPGGQAIVLVGDVHIAVAIRSLGRQHRLDVEGQGFAGLNLKDFHFRRVAVKGGERPLAAGQGGEFLLEAHGGDFGIDQPLSVERAHQFYDFPARFGALPAIGKLVFASFGVVIDQAALVIVLAEGGAGHPSHRVIDVPIALEGDDGGVIGLHGTHSFQQLIHGFGHFFDAGGAQHIPVGEPALAGFVQRLHADDGVAMAFRVAHIVQVGIGFQIGLQVGHVIEILIEIQQNAAAAILAYHVHDVDDGQHIRDVAGGQQDLGFFQIIGVGDEFILHAHVANVLLPGLHAGLFGVLVEPVVGKAAEHHFFSRVGEGDGRFLGKRRAAQGSEQQHAQDQGQSLFHDGYLLQFFLSISANGITL